MKPKATDLRSDEYLYHPSEQLLPVNEGIFTFRIIVFYPGNKKNAYASRHVIENFYELVKKPLLAHDLDLDLSDVRINKCRGRWYKMVGTVALRFDPEREEMMYQYLLESMNEASYSQESFSVIFFDFNLSDRDSSLLVSLEDFLSLDKEHRLMNNFFKNEFYFFDYLEKQFQRLRRFNKVDEFTFSFSSPSRGGSKRIRLSLDYIRKDRSLKIKWELGNETLEDQLNVSKHFSFSDCFQPRVFISIVALLNELHRHELQNPAFTSYTFQYTRFFSKDKKLSYRGEIKSKDRTFFLQLADLTLFSLPVLQSLDRITRELERYYNTNKREISERYLRGKRPSRKNSNLKIEENKDLSAFLE
ncbi:MAG: hypothetical protein ACFFD4_24865 [Candidatus Odinarchaeota archaeon]